MKKKKIRKKQTAKIYNLIFKDKKMGAALLLFVLVSSLLFATFAWYQSQVSLEGSTFTTGTIDFIATGFNEKGEQVTTILQKDKDDSAYTDAGLPLFNKTEWSAGDTDTAYIVIENKGSLDMEYKISFSAAGDLEYLGGFWYALTDITERLPENGSDSDKLEAYIADDPAPQSESDGYNMATMDRYSTYGAITKAGAQKRYYRLDYGMSAAATAADYANKTVEITPAIFVTQEGALDNTDGGYTHNCSTKEDIEKARDSCLPGDSIRLMNNITFEGDLVFNKAVNILTNNYTLEVEGNLIFDFSSPKDFTINATGNGVVKVTSPGEGIGGNFTVNTPASNVTFTGSGNGAGDILVEGRLSVNATRSYGEAGATFSRVKIVDAAYAPATVYVEDDTRITVSESTTIARLEAAARSKNIEVQNAGTVTTLALSGMNVLAQPMSPQIYVVNMGYIVNAIELPAWSEPFIVVNAEPRTCTGNTKIVQTITGNSMSVTGAAGFSAGDIERESTEITVAPIGNTDGELIVYYQNIGGNSNTSVRDLLWKYFTDKGMNAESQISQIRRLDIVSIGDKAVNNADIEYLTGDDLQSLVYLDLERSNVYDSVTGTANKLCDNAFAGSSDLTTLILPQNLEAIGANALSNIGNRIIITVPGSVTEFGTGWYRGNAYVAFSASSPVLAAYTATNGMADVKAVFVEEYYIDAYKAAYTSFAEVIFPMAQLDDNGVHFVRQIPATGEWEIVFYIGGGSTDLTVGGSLHLGRNIINVTGVGDRAYKNTLNNVQVAVEFADGIKYIGESAFAGTGITSVTSWGTSLTTIEAKAFSGCSELAGDVILPQSMVTVEESAFSGCTKITGVNTGGTTAVKSSAFSGCTGLVWVDMPAVRTLEQIGSSNTSSMFYNDKKLVSVKLPSLEQTTGLIFNTNTALREIVFGAEMYRDIAESGFTSFRSGQFGTPKVYFNTPDVSGITVTNVNASYIYPAGEKYGEVTVNGYNIGKYIVSDTLRGDGTATVITANSLTAITGDFVIPAEWNGMPVTAIYKNAFSSNTFSSATVYFPDSLEEIGEGAFYSSSRETGIIAIGSWGHSLRTIGKNAFRNTALTGELVLPANTLVSVGDYAFNSCEKLTSVNTGSASELGIRVFESCTGLTSANLPEVVSVGVGNTTNYSYLFNKCSNLVVVRIPKLSSVTGEGLFYDCDSLREIYMSNDTPVVGTLPYGGIPTAQLEKLKIYVPEELVSAYRSSGVGALKYCIFPDNGIKVGQELVGTYNIGKYILGKNDDGTYTILTSNVTFTGDVDMDTIPELYGYRITKIGAYAFTNYRERTSNSGVFNGQTFTNVNLAIGSEVTVIEDHAFNYAKGIISLDLRNTVTVGAYAFQNCTGLADITGESLTTTDSYAFGGCTSLTALTLENLTTVGTSAFRDCTALESIYFESLASVGNYSFRGCTALKEVIINKAITSSSDVPSQGSNTFQDSTSATILVPMIYKNFYSATWCGRPVASYDDMYVDASGNTYILALDGTECTVEHFLGSAGILSVTVPDTMEVDGVSYTVVGIDAGAFKSVATTLTSVTLPSGMYHFSSGCLSELTALTNISVAQGNRFYMASDGILFSSDGGMLVKYPAGKAGTACTVADTVYAIGEYAFAGCTSLTEITFGANLMVIDSTAFAGCTLRSVIFTGATPPVMMGADIFDTSVEGFAMTVPAAQVDQYVRSMNYARYAPYINSGTDIPAEGAMNKLPWSTATAVAEYAALPPEMPQVKSSEEEDDPTAA